GSRLDARTARLQPHPRPQGHLGQAPGPGRPAITTCSSASALQGPGGSGETSVTISERAAGRGFVLGSEGLGFLAILTAGVGFEVLWRLRDGTNALVRGH